MYRRAYRVAVNSVGVASTLEDLTPIPRAHIAIVPNMIDESAFSPATAVERDGARASLELPLDGFVWVLPGRLSWVKNQIGLLFALWLLLRRGALPPDTLVVLAGRRRDPIPTILIPRLIRLLRLDTHVRVIDAVKNPRVLYAAADALVLPSFAEGMPNVTLEAQLSELPVVVTSEANRDLLVSDGESGLVVPSVSPRALATAMEHLMNLSTERRRHMGRAGRSEILRRFSAQAVSQELATLYAEALGSSKSEVTRLGRDVATTLG
jgi:glycosyltransferase involved in cell wall biosynthesis